MSSPFGYSAQSPLVGLQMDEATAKYVGVLESNIAAYAIEEAKFRALLELLTGESWETTRITPDMSTLMDIAVNALTTRIGMSVVQAKSLVAKRWNALNVAVTPAPKAMDINAFAGTTSNQLDVAYAQPATGSMSDRLASWKSRQSAEAATVSDSNDNEESPKPVVSQKNTEDFNLGSNTSQTVP